MTVPTASATVRAVEAQPDAAIEVNGLQKTYGKGRDEATALSGVSLEVRQGERFALLGPNGAGKTTLVSILSTQLSPTAGEASVLGRSVVREADAVRRTIGYVPQDIALYPTLSAAENLRFFGSLQGLHGSLLRDRIHEVLEISGLEDVAQKKVQTFSGGMKRRLNLAVGLIHHPRLLLLDEPTVGVDPQSRNHILDRIRELNANEGVTILYTAHYMEEVETLCDRVAIIDKGQIIALDAVRALTGNASGAAITVTCNAPDALAGGLAEAEGVCDVLKAESGQVTFTSNTSSAGLATLVQIASARGIEISDVDIGRVSLEQVFLRLTGRALRD
jgi:ABC-2 type transport system ATP-binding protein